VVENENSLCLFVTIKMVYWFVQRIFTNIGKVLTMIDERKYTKIDVFYMLEEDKKVTKMLRHPFFFGTRV
jgi:hypothetical protein